MDSRIQLWLGHVGEAEAKGGLLVIVSEAGYFRPEPEEKENSLRIVWALAWPAVALNSMQVINALLDAFFVGHLSKESLTAYGGMTPVLFLMFSFAMSLGTAATALVSRAYGAQNIAEFKKAAKQNLSLSIIAGFLFLALCLAVAQPASRQLLPEQEQAAAGMMAEFFRIYALGLPAIFVIQCLAGALRGAGDTKSPMMISGLQIALHIVLNIVLINPPRVWLGVTIPGADLGLMGAGWALSGSAWIAAIIYLLYSGKTQLGSQLKVQVPEREWLWRIVRIAIPATVMSFLRVASLTAFQLALKHVPHGGEAIAAIRPSFAIESIMFMPAFGLSMAAAALVGQNLGAGKPERAERLAWSAAHLGAVITLVLCGPIFFAAPWISLQLLGDKPVVVAESSTFLRYLCSTEVFFAYAMVLIGAMQGAGDTKRPLWITVINLWGIRVPLAYVLALAPGAVAYVPVGMGLGATGAWIAMAVTQLTQGLTSIIAFKQGHWKISRV